MNGYSRIRASSNKAGMARSLSPISSPPHPLKNPNPVAKDEHNKGSKLSRTTSSASQRFRDREKSHAMVRRAFSMRKPSSVTEGYWRIHDNEEHWEEQEEQQMKSSGRKKGMILRACKKLFGF